MKKDMKYYVDKYIKMCSLLCKEESDYTEENVKRHNKAMKELIMLKKKLHEQKQLEEEVYEVLLNSEDCYIRQSAATDCLELNCHVDKSVKILKQICRCGGRMEAMTAKRTLRIWNGEIDPREPF